MTNGNTFKSRRDMYAKNIASGQNLRVARAELAHDTGTTPGVAIFNDNYLLFCITAEHAWHLADQLADALDGIAA
jgi:hypothetical protein